MAENKTKKYGAIVLGAQLFRGDSLAEAELMSVRLWNFKDGGS